MNDLLILLGKRVHELRAAKKWSQEEFAHISGFHRTYIGQIERGEKNLSFSNLAKLSSVLGVTMSELLAGIEDGGSNRESQANRGSEALSDDPAHRLFEIQKVARRLKLQRAAMDQAIVELEVLATGSPNSKRKSPGRPGVRNSIR